MLDLERQAAAFKAIEDAGGLAWVIELHGSGISLRKIAAEIPLPRWWLHVWLHDPDHPERLKALYNARKAGAGGIVDEALELADRLSLGATSEMVQATKLQVETRKWLAGKQDSETYGDKQASAGIVLNVAELHLRAVRETRATPSVGDRGEEVAVLEDSAERGSEVVSQVARVPCVEVTQVVAGATPSRQLDLLDAVTE